MQKIRYPLIVSDFDGTLVGSDGNVSKENREAIARYVAAGGTFVVSTGRLPSGILPRVRELGLEGFVCCCQGAIIMDIQSGDLVLDGKLSQSATLAACKEMEGLGLHIHAYDLWEYYANMDDEALKIYEKAVGRKAKLVTDKPLSSFIEETGLRAYKLLAMVEEAQSDEILQKLAATKSEEYALTKSASFLVEVISPNYTKGTAITFLAERLGIEAEQCVAVGDQRNDLEMIEAAGVGIAVKNADDKLKERANCVLEYTNDENAIAKIIEIYGFYEEK